MFGGGVILGELVCLHKVHARKVFVCEEDVGKVLCGDVQELRQAGTGGDIDGVETLLKELIGIGNAAYN